MTTAIIRMIALLLRTPASLLFIRPRRAGESRNLRGNETALNRNDRMSASYSERIL
jgi:hypothetical protein